MESMDTTRCSQCGHTITAGQIACSKCGASVAGGDAQAAGRSPSPSEPNLTPSFTLQPNQVLANRYQVIRLIGRGGMGAIYLAHDRVLNEPVALKTLLPQFAREKTIVERFYNEARIARQLSHPNIVRVHDIGMASQIMYLSMEYVEGKSLRALLEQSGRGLPAAYAMEVLRQLCAGLGYAHRYTVHRDIKPENVMIAKNGAVKLMDFGISKLRGNPGLTVASMVMGTPQYMPPEQFRDSAAVDARADIYSLGVLLYEMLTGALPSGMAKPASQLAPGAPPAIDAIIAKCLEFEPGARYQSAQELAAALEESRQNVEPVHLEAETSPPPVRSSGLLRRMAGAAFLIVLLAGTGFGLWRLLGATPPAAATQGQQMNAAPSAPAESEPSSTDWDSLADKAQLLASASAGASPDIDALLNRASNLRASFPAQALQCYLGVLLRPADDSMPFVPPGVAMLQEGAVQCEIPVDGFFITRRLVGNASYVTFARQMPGLWHVPSYLQGGTLDALAGSTPVVSIPFYYAQGYAAGYAQAYAQEYATNFRAWDEPVRRRGFELPSEAQWVLALQAQREGVLQQVDIARGEIGEWTRTVYGSLPYGPADGREDIIRSDFGAPMVVRGVGAAPAEAAFSRLSMPFQSTSPRVGFRYIKSLPNTPQTVLRILNTLQDRNKASR